MTTTAKRATKAELTKLAEEIKRLPPPEQLRLAAGLLEKERPEIAYHIIDRVRLELGAALAVSEARARGGSM